MNLEGLAQQKLKNNNIVWVQGLGEAYSFDEKSVT